MPTLPERDPNNVLTRKEVEEAVSKMKKNKAVGADGIPIEVYQSSPITFELRIGSLIQRGGCISSNFVWEST